MSLPESSAHQRGLSYNFHALHPIHPRLRQPGAPSLPGTGGPPVSLSPPSPPALSPALSLAHGPTTVPSISAPTPRQLLTLAP